MSATINQIYTLVNNVATQSLGTNAISVVDTSTLVALGDTVLSSTANVEAFMNTLVQRIGLEIFSYRRYDNHYSEFVLNDFEWGAIVQKIKVKMVSASQENSILTDGKSVDMYVVSKPKATQKLFTKETPYKFYVTIQREWLKEAFTSGAKMDGFIAMIYGEVENSINLALENLVMSTINNYIAEVSGSAREIKLVTEYNAETGEKLTATTAMHSDAFLRFAIRRIKDVGLFMTRMLTMFNDGTETRHTPYEMQRLQVLGSFEHALETVVQYQAFNEDYVKLVGYKMVPFFQSAKTPNQVIVTRASDAEETTVSNIVGILFDRDALGIYKKDEWTATTPLNADGGYFNTFWHMKELYFNDLSENFVLFTLN